MPIWRLLHLKNYPIFEQLQLEEALLRADDGNWCLINEGSPKAVVMGISGHADQLLNADVLQEKPIPVIRRFSGGGTVIVDEQTHFITFIANGEQLGVPPCPQKVLRWTENLYRPLFHGLDFHAKENDYVIGNQKFGGNAQYMRKQRWLHHSSLLWDYQAENMNYLKIPARMPQYREKRSHLDFLCRLSAHLPERELLSLHVKNELKKDFTVLEMDLCQVKEILLQPHRKSVAMIESF
jgi:lipoate---protein ligase